MRVLNLSQNKMKDFGTLKTLTSLATLDVSQNQLTDVSNIIDALGSAPSLALLSIHSNPLSGLLLCCTV